MISNKLAIKLFAKPGTMPDIDSIVPVFHAWIQNHAIDDHMLVDVADYKHVQDGPGAVLVSHEANFSTDQAHGRPGLLYNRKQPFAGANDLADRIRQTLLATLRAAQLLEHDTPARFETNEILFRIHDRLHAPNTAETLAAVTPALQSVFGREVVLNHKPNPQTLFEVTIKSPASGSLNQFLARFAAANV